MSLPAIKSVTYDDLLDLPENMIGEIINGELHAHPRPAPKHAWAYSSLGFNIGGLFGGGIGGGPGGWWIIDEPELHLGYDIVVPDLAGWKRTTMPELPETAWFETPPDWVCEILSPSTARNDRILKMPLYASHGVKHLWLVDPELQTLEVYQLENKHWSLIATLKDDDPVSQAPFDAITFSLDALWA
jgi:Uma2 family endonuclease